jgi:hypothetical protein
VSVSRAKKEQRGIDRRFEYEQHQRRMRNGDTCPPGQCTVCDRARRKERE